MEAEYVASIVRATRTLVNALINAMAKLKTMKKALSKGNRETGRPLITLMVADVLAETAIPEDNFLVA
jgi:hypothetical protein